MTSGAGVDSAQAYPLQHFLEAWNDSNCLYLATNDVPENLVNSSQLAAQFNDSTDIYMTPDFWINIGVKVAGVAVATMIQSYLADSFSADHSGFDTGSPWETLTDLERDRLFLVV